MSMAQKKPLARTLNRWAQETINDAFQRTGQALPCSVVTVSGAVVTVKFEVNSAFTLPNVTIPLAGAEYIRYPIQIGCKGVTVPADARLAGVSGIGCKGVTVPADARLAGVSGIGGGVSDLSMPANLTALVFLPIGNAGWGAVDPDAVVIYGPNGVVLRDSGNASSITVTPSGIVMQTETINLNGTLIINGTPYLAHVHGGVITGGDDTTGVV
jgi:hypothetical protein